MFIYIYIYLFIYFSFFISISSLICTSFPKWRICHLRGSQFRWSPPRHRFKSRLKSHCTHKQGGAAFSITDLRQCAIRPASAGRSIHLARDRSIPDRGFAVDFHCSCHPTTFRNHVCHICATTVFPATCPNDARSIDRCLIEATVRK